MARNSYFRFKQFTIQQDNCAMKVCTDACTFGAWANLGSATHVLDIGSGTGLLTLMLAQRHPTARFTGVEVDGPAYEQSLQNIQASPFRQQIGVVHAAIQDFVPGFLYDRVVSNPPFYQSSLKSPSAQKNAAHHGDTMDFKDLLESVVRLLKPDGELHVLLPWEESQRFLLLAAQYGFALKESLALKDQVNKNPFRRLMSFQRQNDLSKGLIDRELVIYSLGDRAYTAEFEALLSPFYLNL